MTADEVEELDADDVDSEAAEVVALETEMGGGVDASTPVEAEAVKATVVGENERGGRAMLY